MANKNSTIATLDDDAVATDAVVQTPAPEVLQLNTKHSAELSGSMETVTIHGSEGEGGMDAVFVSHDGYAFQIPRDKPCTVPTEVAQILRDAKVTTYVSSSKGQAESSRPRFACTFQPVLESA